MTDIIDRLAPSHKQHSKRRTGRAVLRVTELEDRTTPAVHGFNVLGSAIGQLPIVTITRTDGSIFAQILAFDGSFRGGVSAALGEIDGNPNTTEIVAGAGPGGSPHVRIFSIDASKNVLKVASFFAFDASFTGGVSVATGDINNDGRAEVIVGAGPGGGPHVRSFFVQPFVSVSQVPGRVGSFFAFAPTFTGGVNVAAGDLTGDGFAEVVAAAGPGGGPHVIALAPDGHQVANFFAFPASFTGGVTLAPITTGQLLMGAGPTGAFGTSQVVFIAGQTFLTPLTPFTNTPLGVNLLGPENAAGAFVTAFTPALTIFGTNQTNNGVLIIPPLIP